MECLFILMFILLVWLSGGGIMESIEMELLESYELRSHVLSIDLESTHVENFQIRRCSKPM